MPLSESSSSEKRPTAVPLRPKQVASRKTKDSEETLLHVRRRAVRRILLLVVLLVALSIASPLIQTLSPTKTYAVASESMEPGIAKGALVVTSDRPVQTGDVVVYWSPLGEHQVHRIVEIVHDGDRVFYRTAGDANDAEDAFLVPAEQIEGKVLHQSPYVGYLWLLPVWVQAVIFGGAVLGYLAFTVWEARALLRRRFAWFTALGCVFLILLVSTPTWAGVTSGLPSSALTNDVTSATLPFSAGPAASTEVSADRNSATVTAPMPRLWKEIPMWNCKKEAHCTNSLSPGFSEETGSWARIDMAHYVPAPTAYFEAYIAAPDGTTAMIHLYDTTNNVEVAGSQVETTSTTLTLVRSGGFSLSGVKDYTIRSGHTGTGQGGEIAHARLLLVQDAPTKTAEQVRVSQGTEEATTSWAVPARANKWRFEGGSTDGISTARFEIIAEVDGGMLTNSYVRLVDRTAGTTVATITVGILDTRAKRFVSGDIQTKLIDGHEYEIEARRGDGLLSNRLHLYVARVLIAQSDFTTTVRYVDLSWKTTTSATSFTMHGYPGSYHMDEWGGRTGYFEVTMRNTNRGGTSSAHLFDRSAASAVAGTTIAVTGTTMTRVRSAVDLAASDASYNLRIKADSGTAEIRQGWLIVPQGSGKTYDHVLSAAHEAVPGCTWSVTLAYVSATNLSRIRHATIALRADQTADQIRIEQGTLAVAVGTPLSIAYGATVDHLVTTDPERAGATTIHAEQRARCAGSGIHTAQPVVFRLT